MGFPRVFCDVAGRRHMPGICWYPAKRTGHAVNQGGTADSVVYSSLTDSIFLSRTFLCDTGNPVLRTPLTEIKSEEFFIF
jgi:hypothetical protein